MDGNILVKIASEHICGTCGYLRRIEGNLYACSRSDVWRVVDVRETCGDWYTALSVLKRGAGKAPNPTEEQEQNRLFEWCELQLAVYPELGLLYHILNGGKRNKSEAFRLKTVGVKRGVPDLCLPVARGAYHGLYIELKRLDGGRVAPEQRDWLAKLTESGYCAAVCNGFQAAQKLILCYLQLQADKIIKVLQ